MGRAFRGLKLIPSGVLRKEFDAASDHWFFFQPMADVVIAIAAFLSIAIKAIHTHCHT